MPLLPKPSQQVARIMILSFDSRRLCRITSDALIFVGAARTRAPSATNYDVHSPAWGDARANSPSGSAMEAPALGHRPC